MKRLGYKGTVPSMVGAPLALSSLLVWGEASFLDKKRWPCGEARVTLLGMAIGEGGLPTAM